MFKYLRSRQRFLLLLFFICTLVALLNIGVLVSDDLAHNKSIEWARYFVNEFTGTYALFPLLILLFAFFREYPIREGHWWSGILLYLGVSVLFGVVHTSLMYASRVPLYALIGEDDLQRYFDRLPYRYLMEYFKQFVTFWVAYSVHLILLYVQKKQEAQIRNADLQKELAQAQLQGLQTKLHPHFLFNTLNTVSSVMYDEPARADRLISKLSSFLRKMLDLENQHFHPLEKELFLLDQYTDIMLERYSNHLSVERSIARDTLSALVPVLILQPLIENAIKYSIAQNGQARVELNISRRANRLQIRLADNGPGFSQQLAGATGLGLSSTFARLDASYGDDYSFHMQNLPTGGLAIRMDLPISSEYVSNSDRR